jgi:orotate phosphoribosyltransferase
MSLKSTFTIGLLRKIIGTGAFKKGDFTLTSGQTSDTYLDIKLLLTYSYGLKNAVDLTLLTLVNSSLPFRRLDAVAGLELGGITLASMLASRLDEDPDIPSYVDALWIRKQPKSHGTISKVEGHVFNGMKVLIVKDVTTTGRSAMIAVNALRELDLDIQIMGVITIVDREEGASELFAKEKIPFFSCVTLEMIDYFSKHPDLTIWKQLSYID